MMRESLAKAYLGVEFKGEESCEYDFRGGGGWSSVEMNRDELGLVVFELRVKGRLGRV